MPDNDTEQSLISHWLGAFFELFMPMKFEFKMSAEEYEARCRENEAAADPSLVSFVKRTEQSLGITFGGGPFTPFETRAAVVRHLLDPTNPQFHSEDVAFYLRSYVAKEPVDGWPHPVSLKYPNPLRRRTPLLTKHV
jgi:hypothetical protein